MKLYKHFILVAAALYSVAFTSCSDDDDDNNSTTSEPANAYDTHAVDLGLPSGLKWSDQNLGANAPEEYGNYYAWGSLTPLSSFDSESYYAEVDVKNIPHDYSGDVNFDPAAHDLGGKWRTPTSAEIKELRLNTTVEWTAVNGVKGLKLIGPNGNSIFVPAGGQYSGTVLTKETFQGTFWSSTQDGTYEGFGMGGLVNAGGFGGVGGYGYLGYNVRPVRD